MIRFAEWLGHWSVDVYLLGSILLLLSLLAMAGLRQPVHRLAVVKSLLVGLVLLAGLCAVPGWSALHLMTAKPEISKETFQPVTPIAVPAIAPDDLQPVEPPPISVAPMTRPAANVEVASHINLRPWAVAGAIELIGAIGVILWLAAGWLIARALRRRSHDARPDVQQLLSRIAEATSFKRNFVPNVLVCDQFDVPVALGLRRPVIVLPARLLEPLSASAIPQAELSTVLAHELAHVQNLDLAWLALSRGLLAVFWAQPLYWLTRRRMRLDQESLADAAAAELTSREQYAEQLVGWARNLANGRTMRLASAVGLWEGASQLRQRVAILLDESVTILRRCSSLAKALSAILAIGAAMTLSLITIQPGHTAPAENGKDKDAAIEKTVSPTTGSLTIRFEYAGTPPERKEIKEYIWPAKSDDRELGRIDINNVAGAKVFDESLVVGKDRGITNVLIWVRSPNIPAPPVGNLSPTTITLEKGRISPHVAAFQGPRELLWKNETTTLCNINFNESGFGVNRRLEAGEQASCKVPVDTAHFDNAPVNIISNDHLWLKGWLLVRPNPYVAVSDEHGVARIENLPLGKWEFQVWHERAGWIQTIDWQRGRFEKEIEAGENDLGTRKLSPAQFGVQQDVSTTQTGADKRTEDDLASGDKPNAAKGDQVKETDLTIVIARHVMLLDGKEIVTWDDIESKIATLPDPSKAVPHFYFTNGVIESGGQPAASRTIYELQRKYKLTSHSEGTLLPRAGLRYDRIEKASDLVPDESLRVEGTVVDSQGKPVAGAEVVLVTPIDSAVLPYTAYDVVLVQGRLRNRLDEVCTKTDAAGHFAIYPAKGQKYCVLAIHPESGIHVARSDGFPGSNKISLLPWATVEAKLDQDSDPPQTASLITRIREQDGYPAVNLSQYWRDLKQEKATDTFRYSKVPAILETDIARWCEQGPASITVSGASVSLLPDENRQIDLGTLSDKQREYLKDRRDKFGTEQHTSKNDQPKSSGTEQAAKLRPTELAGQVIGPDGKPLAGVTADANTWYPGNEATTDDEGRFVVKGLNPHQAVEIEFRKDGYEPRLFANGRALVPNWVVKMGNSTYLEGDVLDSQGKPVADALVRATRGPITPEPGFVVEEVTTQAKSDAKGLYRLYLEPDSYDLQLRVPGRGVARYQGEKITKDEKRKLDIHLQRGITFRAKVVDSVTRKPVPGITLWNWQRQGIEGTSNAEGILEIPDMFPGPLIFSVAAVGDNRNESHVAGQYARWWSPQAADERQQKLTLDRYGLNGNWDELQFNITSESSPATIFVEPCVTVTGHVVDPDGKPVEGATIAPAATGSGNSLTGDTRYSYRTVKDGEFEMKLPSSDSGKYNLIAHDGKYEEWRRWANAVGEPFQTHPGERIENVTLRLTQPASVRGRVTVNGKPAAGKQVRAADFAGHDNRYYLPTTETDAHGNFELKFVSPGKQYIQAEPFFLEANQAVAGTSSVVDVKEGETVELETPLKDLSTNNAGSTVNVDVANESQQPIQPIVTAPTPAGDSSADTANSAPPQPSFSNRPRLAPNTLAGIAFDENQQPIGNVDIFVFQVRQSNGERKLVAQKKTDGEGKFLFENVLDLDKLYPDHKIPSYSEIGDDFVDVIARKNGRESVSQVDVPQMIARQGMYHAYIMQPGATLRGRVTAANGKPVKDALVSVQTGWIGSWEGASSSRTDSDGRYEITDAPAFDLAEFKKKAEQEERARFEGRGNNTATFTAFSTPPQLAVSHPDFAMFTARFEKSPGTKDVKLSAPAIITGRVVQKPSDKPVDGAVVTAATRVPITMPSGEASVQPFYKSTAATDAEGNYRITTLPAGDYNLWVDKPGLLNPTAKEVTTTTGQKTVAPPLDLSNGGLVRVRILDAATQKPLEIVPNMKALLLAESLPLERTRRPVVQQHLEPTKDGRFETRVPTGRIQITAFDVEVDGISKWFGANLKRPVLDVADDQVFEIDLPVADNSQPTGYLQLQPSP